MLEGAIDLMHRIHEEFTFDATATSVATPLTRVLEEQRGVCQDFAHLQIAALRALGLPARYVSGYLLTNPPPGQPRLIGADASHAWVSVSVSGERMDSFSIRRTTSFRQSVTSRWHGDAITATSVRCAVSSSAARVIVCTLA
ncbi:MAG: transglutaminase family protein [Vicinamibacterales bacterium]